MCIRKRCGPPECKNPPCDDVSNVVIYASASGGAVVIVILIIIVVCIIRKKKTDGHDDTTLTQPTKSLFSTNPRRIVLTTTLPQTATRPRLALRQRKARPQTPVKSWSKMSEIFLLIPSNEIIILTVMWY